MQFIQDISYSRKFHGKRGFPNLANGRTFQFMFLVYLTQYQNLKAVKSKLDSEKSKKQCILKRKREKKTLKHT